MEEIIDEHSYFDLLPVEILLKIFGTTKTVDFLIFCKAYPQFEYLYEEKKLMNVVDLSRPTVLMNVPDFMDIVSKQLIAEYITVFNMNYIYWISAADIRKCLKKFINVEELYLLGTKMRMNQADCECYKKLKLRKIALPIQYKDLLNLPHRNFPHLESLCVQIIQKADTFQLKLQSFVRNLRKLRELWIDDISHHIPLSCQSILNVCEGMKIFVFKGPYFTFCSASRACPDLKTILLNDLNGSEIHAYLESNKDIMNIHKTADINTSWGRLLPTAVPYGLSDGKELTHGTKNLNTIRFQELNLRHNDALVEHDTITDKRNVIFSNNSRFVKKVSLETCIFEDQPEHRVGSLENCQRMKALELKFKYFLGNVNELEICICNGHEDLKLYFMPQYLKKLTHLYLEIPIALDGHFLKAIMENCEELHTLNIQLNRSNESFCHGFYRFISLARNLRKLRLNHYRISFERLFYGLSLIKNPRMESLYLTCNVIDNIGLESLRKFVEMNRNLKIIAIACTSLTERTAKLLKDEMQLFMNSPEKVFMIEKSESHYDYPFISKDFTKFQFSSSDTFVSTVNVFEEFPKNNLSNKN